MAFKYFTFMPLEARGDRWKQDDEAIGSRESIWDIDSAAIQLTYMYLYEKSEGDNPKCINQKGELFNLDSNALPEKWKKKLLPDTTQNHRKNINDEVNASVKKDFLNHVFKKLQAGDFGDTRGRDGGGFKFDHEKSKSCQELLKPFKCIVERYYGAQGGGCMNEANQADAAVNNLASKPKKGVKD